MIVELGEIQTQKEQKTIFVKKINETFFHKLNTDFKRDYSPLIALVLTERWPIDISQFLM